MRSDSLKIVDKVISEEIKNRIHSLGNKIFEDKKMKKELCSECGSKRMYEGECKECGYMEENKGMCSECGSGNMVEGECKECGYSEGQQHIAKQAKPYNKIGANDFAKLRAKKTEVKEKLYGRQSVLDKNKNNKIDAEDFELIRKESVTYKIVLDESTNETFYFKESEVINIIENIVLEEKKKKKSKTKTLNVTKSAQTRSKKENDNYINSVVKKMKDYLKGGSKGDYEMDAKHFPKGNGELAKMSKKAYIPSDAVDDYVKNFTAAGLENLDFNDGIKPNEEWMEDLLVGSSRTGNNSEWANSVETPVNKERNKIRKDNLLAKLKRKAYNKSSQPVNDQAGENTDKASKIMMKLESTEEKVILEDIQKIKNLISYGKKTQ
jgi:hypothetical protein